MAALIDGSILVFRFDPRSPRKQKIASSLLRRGIENDDVRVPYQAIVEFVDHVTHIANGSEPLLPPDQGRREAEELLSQFTILYPSEAIVRMALRGAAAYQLSWNDAQTWAYAECYGLDELVSENFQHDRLYGTVRAINPFIWD